MTGLLAGLNDEQKRAVTAGEGPLLVLAGAGTGKTRVLTTRIAWLLHEGAAAPEEILAVTFTNKAAREMRERVAALVDLERAGRLTIGTFHSVCVRWLRRFGEAIGLPRNFAICDGSDQLAAIQSALRDLRVPEASLAPRDALGRISLLKNRLVRRADYEARAASDEERLLAAAWRHYEGRLRRTRSLDFDDLLLETLRLLEEREEVLAELQDRYRWLLVDEFQDTNTPQFEIVRRVAGKRRNLCAVGDDDQSIYGWRGADVGKILSFTTWFPGARVLRLETNYRSTSEILDAANAVIAHNPTRHGKTLRSAAGSGAPVHYLELEDEEDEASLVVGGIQHLVRGGEARLGDCAILVRTATQPRIFEAELRSRDLPYRLVGSMSFFDRKEVRDVLAFLRLLANPDDEVSFLRIVNCPPRGVGRTSLDRALAFATEHGIPVPRAFERAAEIPDLPPAAARAVAALFADLDAVRPLARAGRLVQALEELLERVGYRGEIERLYPDPEARMARQAGVDEILNFAENHERRSRRGGLEAFLEDLALNAADDRSDEEDGPRDAVTLMTLHAAKGLEFPRVWLVGVEEGLLPHARSLAENGVEEERRLMYVGITRAREQLTVTWNRARARRGRREPRLPSRFLFEMRGETPPEAWTAAVAAGRTRPEPPPQRRRKRRARSRGTR